MFLVYQNILNNIIASVSFNFQLKPIDSVLSDVLNCDPN